jgi:hypothetical protein
MDAALFALALWLAHSFRELFHEISHFSHPFELYIWLYLIIIPATPLVLESQGFYSRPLFGSRWATIWPLLRGCTFITIGVILVMFLFRVELARGVIILFGVAAFATVAPTTALTPRRPVSSERPMLHGPLPSKGRGSSSNTSSTASRTSPRLCACFGPAWVSLGTLDKLHRHLPVRVGSRRTRVVEHSGKPVARRLREPDRAGDDGREDELAEVAPHLVDDDLTLVSQQVPTDPRISKGSTKPFDRPGHVEVPSAEDRSQELNDRVEQVR